MKLTTLLAGVALAAICSGPAVSATVLYDNGPINGTIQGIVINGGTDIGDSFTLTKTTTVTGVNFGAWALPGDTALTVDWGITSSPTVVADNHTANVTTGPATLHGGFDIGVDSFSTGAVTLGPGTYYLWLENAVTKNGSSLFWDINNGASTANWGYDGVFVGSAAGTFVRGTNSESFQILGGVPEPTTWAMMLAGFGGIGAVMRRSRKARGAALTA